MDDLANAHNYQQALDDQLEDEKRRLDERRTEQAKKYSRLKGMDPIQESRRKKQHPDSDENDEESEEDEEN